MTHVALSLFFLFFPPFQDQWKDVYSETAWGDRDRWQKPDALIKALNVKPGAAVADIGCHEGYMTVKLAAAVAPGGKVYAVDVSQGKLDRLNANLEKRKIGNVLPIKGDFDDPKLPLNSVDGVIILDTYHEIDAHDQVLARLWTSLKPGGRLVICDPVADDRRKLTRAEQTKKHELSMEFALEDLKRANFLILRREDRFIDRREEKGDMMWIIVAAKPNK